MVENKMVENKMVENKMVENAWKWIFFLVKLPVSMGIFNDTHRERY